MTNQTLVMGRIAQASGPRRWWGPKWLAVPAAVASVLVVPGATMPAVASAAATVPLAAEVLTAPQPVPGTDRHTHLVYEIVLRNEADREVRLDRVEVRGRGILSVLDGGVIESRLFSLAEEAFTQTLAPDESGMLLLDVALARRRECRPVLTTASRWPSAAMAIPPPSSAPPPR